MHSVRRMPRLLTTLALTSTLAASALGPIALPLAAEPIIRDHRDPNARVEVVIRKVTIHDDMDWGAGEIKLKLRVRANENYCEPYGGTCGRILAEGSIPQFSANDGVVKQLDRVLPAEGDTFADSSIGPGIGIPKHQFEWLGFDVIGTEDDAAADDNLGMLQADIRDKTGPLRFGVNTERSRGRCANTPIAPDFCPPGVSGAFSVEYEIRPAPLPDLWPDGRIEIFDVPGSTRKNVCMGVWNVGTADSGPFEVALRVDGVTPPGGRYNTTGLIADSGSPVCIEADLPTGVHRLSTIVDEPEAVIEFDETKNHVSKDFTITNSGPAPIPSPGPIVINVANGTGPGSQAAQPPVVAAASPAPNASAGAGQADLIVSTVKVNGQVPVGKDDCKDGKNTVAVTVKNPGAEKAGAFAVRLDADGDELGVESVNGLEAGKERELRFEDVRLKKGEHQLTAAVDSKKAVSESNEENNELKVTVRCKDDN